MTRRYVTAPPHVAACDLGPATVLVNYRTGDVQALYGLPARWWAELDASGDTTITTALDVPAALALLGRLHAVGLLMFLDRPRFRGFRTALGPASG